MRAILVKPKLLKIEVKEGSAAITIEKIVKGAKIKRVIRVIVTKRVPNFFFFFSFLLEFLLIFSLISPR